MPHSQRPLISVPLAFLGFHYPVGATFPAPYPVSEVKAQQAYCRAWGLTWQPEPRPEVSRTAPHPRSYRPECSIVGIRTVTLKGQTGIFG